MLTCASETWHQQTEREINWTFLKGKCVEEFQAQYMTMKKKTGEY